jgi:ADP-ribosyl-[dinitrogen reductase] hydrolase
MQPTIENRILGCLLGGAVGDALGAPIEFMSWKQIKEEFGEDGVTGYEEAYGRKGAITDDTQMTLFTADSLIRAENRWEVKGLCNPVAVIQFGYFRWLLTQGEKPPVKEGWIKYIDSGWLVTNDFLHHQRAPGATVTSSLRKSTELSIENNSKGCGGVMRVAPIGLVANEPFTLGSEAAHITHGHPTGYLSAGVFSQIVSSIRDGKSLIEAIDISIHYLKQQPSHQETLDAVKNAVVLAETSSLTVDNVESLGEGWVAEEALAIALFCALRSDNFLSGVLAAVNHSGDCDSTGSICGNLLGTLHGVEAIPHFLLDDLEGREVIEQLGNDLIDKFIRNPDGESCNKDRYPCI